MRILLDENLSPRLVPRLLSLFSELVHVRDVGLKQANDEDIWKWAKANDYLIITTDADFVGIYLRKGWPPKIAHIERCDFPMKVIEELLRRNAVPLSEFERVVDTGVLTLRLVPHANSFDRVPGSTHASTKLSDCGASRKTPRKRTTAFRAQTR